MATGVIDRVVDPKVYEDVLRLDKELTALVATLQEVNTTVGNSKSFTDYNANLQKSVKVQKEIQETTEKSRLADIRLAQQREKAFDDYEKTLKKQSDLAEKNAEKTRLAELKLQQDREKAFDAYEKKIAQQSILAEKNAQKAQQISDSDVNNSKKAQIASDKKALADEKNAEKSRLSEIRLQQQREKSFDSYEKKVNKQSAANQKAADSKIKADEKEAASNKRKSDKQIADDQKELASMVKLAKQREKDSNLYIQLSKKLEEQRLQTKDIGIRYGTDSQLFKDSSAEVQSLDKRLKSLDSTLGQSQRNVGNYAGKAFGAIRTLANILPNFGIGTAFLLIFEGIAKVYTLLADGENILKTVSELNRRVNDTYATQSVNVSLLVKEVNNQNTSQERQKQILEELNHVSPTYFGNLKDTKDLVTLLPDAYKRYNDALLLTAKIEAAKSLITEKYKKQLELQGKIVENLSGGNDFVDKLANQAGVLTTVGNAFSTFGFGLKGSLEYASKSLPQLQKQIQFLTDDVISNQQKLQENGGDIAGTGIKLQERLASNFVELEKIKNEAYINGQKTIADNDKKSYSIRFQALKNAKDAELRQSQMSTAQELGNSALQNDERAVIEQKGIIELEKINLDYEKSKKDLHTKSINDDIELQKSRLERAKSDSRVIIDDENSDFEDRLIAIDTFEKKSTSIIELEAKQQLSNAGENTSKIKEAYEKRRDELNKVIAQSIKDRQKIYNQENKEYIEGGKKAVQDSIAAFSDANNKRLLDAEQSRTDQLSVLADQYSKGLISQKEYQQKKAEIEKSASLESIDSNIKETQEKIALQKLAVLLGFADNKDLQRSEDELTRFQISRSKLVADAKIADEERVKAKKIDTINRIREIEDQLQGFVSALSNGVTQRRLEDLKAEGDELDKETERKLAAADREILSDTAKQEKKNIINAKAQAQRDVLGKREADLKTKQARFEKALNIASIISNTAAAIAKDLVGNKFLIPFDIFTGAVQLATALATPIPKYKDGLTSAQRAHIGIYGEAGTEAIKKPGQPWYLSDGATVDHIPVGTQIVSNKDLMGMISKPEKINFVGGQALDINELLKEQKATTNAVKNIKLQLPSNNIGKGLSQSYLKRNGFN